MSLHWNYVRRLLLASSMLLSPWAANAQTALTTPAIPATSDGDIVVTAEKRDSTVQKTPISMTAITGAALQAQGTTDLLGIIHEVPGISIRSSGPGQTELEMRGLSSSAGSSPTVGFYLGETALTPAANSPIGKAVIDPDLFDLNRVEVLRGPQGTLYGSGSMGGTVKLVPNAPNASKVEGNIDGTLSGTQGGGLNPSLNVMLNLPIVSDKVALRVVFTEKHRSGWIDRDVVPGFPQPVAVCGLYGAVGCQRGDLTNAHISEVHKNANWANLVGGRASILIRPTDRLSITASGMYQVQRLGGYDDYDQNPGNPSVHYQPYNIKEPFRDKFVLGEAEVSYDFDAAALTSVTSYWSRSQRQTQDVSEALSSFFANFFGAPGFVPITYTEADRSHQFSQELRLASTGTGRFTWLIGGYFSQFKSTYKVLNAAAAYAPLSTGGASANPDGIVYAANNPYALKQYAVFGNASFAITPALKLDLGLRWYRFDTNVDEAQSGIGTATGNATPTTLSLKTRNSGVNPKATLSYQPGRDLNFYATVSRGFRPGGVNLPIPQDFGCQLTDETYGPDHIWNYELGEKARLFDRRVTLNADFYYISWKGAQQTINQSCGFALYKNAGNARAYGPEVELSASLSRYLSINMSGTYTKADITSVDPTVAATDSLQAGSPILNIPNFTANASVNFRKPVSEKVEFSARATESFVGSSTDVSLVREKLPSYNIVGVRVGLIAKKVSAFLFIDNLTNEVAQLSVNTTAFSWPIPSLTRVVTNQPRTFGVNLFYRF